MNVFISDSAITAIDIDKFSQREPEADVGYFLMQTAAFDFFENGSFDFTEPARRRFLQAYENETGWTVRQDRTAFHMAASFLKNLHFEVVLLKTGNTEYVEPWLWGATATVLDRNLFLTT